jgi:hypothetical protein
LSAYLPKHQELHSVVVEEFLTHLVKKKMNFSTGMKVMAIITFLKYLSFSASLVIKEFQRSSPKAATIEAFVTV